MNPNYANQIGAVEAGPYNLGSGNAAKASAAGVASAIKELLDAAGQMRNTADNLRSALGISQPETAQQGPPQEPGSLRNAIIQAVQLIRAADYDAGECLRHINS